jgi:hypothetical protein
MSTAGSKQIDILRRIRIAKGLTRQQITTLRGQALHGDIIGAYEGLNTILRRKNTT